MIPLHGENRASTRFPIITALIIFINALVFFYTYSNLNYFVSIFGFSSGRLLSGEAFTIITAAFIHANSWHLLGNMWFLWVFGKGLESKIGSLKFILLYLVCILGSDIVYSLAMSMTSMVIGASGAISGILGAYFVLLPKSKIKTYIPPVFFVNLPAIIYIFFWFFYQLLATSKLNAGVAYWAHIGGFLTGMLLINSIKWR